MREKERKREKESKKFDSFDSNITEVDIVCVSVIIDAFLKIILEYLFRNVTFSYTTKLGTIFFFNFSKFFTNLKESYFIKDIKFFSIRPIIGVYV